MTSLPALTVFYFCSTPCSLHSPTSAHDKRGPLGASLFTFCRIPKSYLPPLSPPSLYLAVCDTQEDTTEVQRIVVEQLHSYIDPFDLSVFAPHLLSALERQLQRSTVRKTHTLLLLWSRGIVALTIEQ